METEYAGQPSYDEGRKQHVKVSQDAYLELMRDLVPIWGEPGDFAEFFGVSEATARKKLDGLVAQGLAVKQGTGYRAKT